MSQGAVYNLMCERKTEVGLIKEWDKKVFVHEEDLPEFIKKYNLRTRGGLLYIAEFIQKNQRRPKFAVDWVMGKHAELTRPVIKRTRRTRAQMEAMRANAAKTAQTPAKRHHRTKAQMEEARATMQ